MNTDFRSDRERGAGQIKPPVVEDDLTDEPGYLGRPGRFQARNLYGAEGACLVPIVAAVVNAMRGRRRWEEVYYQVQGAEENYETYEGADSDPHLHGECNCPDPHLSHGRGKRALRGVPPEAS